MMLDATKVPDLCRVLASDKPEKLEKIRGADVSITAAMSLGLLHRHHLSSGDTARAQRLGSLSLPGVQSAIRALRARRRNSTDPFGAPKFELYRICSPSDVATEEWTLFYDRFRRSATGRRKSDMFRSVGGVLGEIGDNVPSHAYRNEDSPFDALAGFHVGDGVASFCVCDLGQGFLASLRSSTVWAHLRTEQDALDAVVNRHATSRTGENEGGGFKQLFNMLLDFNGLVLIRSGNCTFQLSNEGHTRRLQVRSSSEVPGSSVTVVISQAIAPKEIALHKNA